MSDPEDRRSPRDRASPTVTRQGPDGVRDHTSDIFFSAIETTRMPMLLTDPNQPDNPIVFANRAFLAMTGYAPEELMGRNCRFLQGQETDRETVTAIREGIEAESQVSVEILNYRKDGSSFWNALFISPVYNPDGRLAYFFASQLDVSRRRDAEAALRQSQRMEAVGQLTGGISHDFNNLLQVMSGALAMLRKGGRLPTDARSVQLVEAMDGAVARASTLTQQLLAFSRKQTLQGRVVNLNALIGGMGEIADRTLGDDVELDLRLAPDLLNVRIDPTQAELALLNVLINARDAMPEGGRITVLTANVTVGRDGFGLDGLAPGAYVRVAITDTGTGIPEAIIKKVMEPFFTTKEEGKGTGLGLSMVYGFAKQSGGLARIYSEEGKGTTVSLVFPALSGPAEAETASGLATRSLGGSERILVVDDRPDVAQMTQLMLQDVGYAVDVVDSGRHALDALARSASYKLLVSDIVMPGGMNGIELARRARARDPRLKVLLMTGFATDVLDGADPLSAGFDVILKPFTQGDLVRRARLLLDGPTGVD
jgi:PAS domain S-box-containing protein